MPELPEVETVRRGIEDTLINQKIDSFKVSVNKLRYPISQEILAPIKNAEIKRVARRGKHLLFILNNDYSIIIHLGMSGTLQLFEKCKYEFKKHDHIVFDINKHKLVYNDPRKFGYCLVTKGNPLKHKVLASHGPEPFSNEFNVEYLEKKLKKLTKPIKQSIMDNKIVVGVGNIYASEALFLSKIHPLRATNSINKFELKVLIKSIQDILNKSIQAGGTTLKDYKNADGKPGYFTQELSVYGKRGEECHLCGHTISSKVIGQRNTYFCDKCQM